MANASEVDDQSLIKRYVQIRDSQSQRKAAYDLDDQKDKSMRLGIETEFLRRFNERGIDSVSSRDFGVAYRTTRTSTSVADFEALLGHVKENEAWELIERRVNKTAVQEFVEEHGDLPPGVNMSSVQQINFRRK
jgi:hypothetical protein